MGRAKHRARVMSPWAPPPGWRSPDGVTPVQCAAILKTRRAERTGAPARCNWVALPDSSFCRFHQDPSKRGGVTPEARERDTRATAREEKELTRWRETPEDERLLAPVRCDAVNVRGEQCMNLALPALATCHAHTTRGMYVAAYAGASLAAQNLMRARVEAETRAGVTFLAPTAVDKLEELMRDGPPGVQLRAADSILDRAGLSKKYDSTLDVQLHDTRDDSSPDPLHVLTERLNEIASRASAAHPHADEVDAAALPSGLPGEILDAEVVDE